MSRHARRRRPTPRLHGASTLRRFVGIVLAGVLASSAVAESRSCLGCHDGEDASAAHAMLQTAHAQQPQACEACHGPSLDHARRPRVASPDISFGPRWTANSAEQDSSCLDCHAAGVAAHWSKSLHMANNVTCVTCHDAHDVEQNLSDPDQQRQICTTCHKTQKSGIHGKPPMVSMNPACTQCHNPHADQRPVGVMLANDSVGCRRCHNLKAMARSGEVSAEAKAFHRVMDSGDRTCVDCHQGVTHGDTDAVEPFLPLPETEGDITLFLPGQSDVDWLLTEHPGSQPLRQGSNCRQCHRGEEAALGAALSNEEPSSREVGISFAREADLLVTRVTWPDSPGDDRLSLMWGFGNYDPLHRGGCWAACHGDLPGMHLDAGSGRVKYLWSAREQRRQSGLPANTRTGAELAEAMRDGEFAELWQVDLTTGQARTGTILARIRWLDREVVTATAVRDVAGNWTVEWRRPLRPAAPLLPVDATGRYTFGIALHGKAHAGADHWVSLPMTLSVDKDDTDFIIQ